MSHRKYAVVVTGVCSCGCGQVPPLARYTSTSRGWIKGQPKRAIRGHRVAPIRTNAEVRFWSHVKKTATCWLWTGTRLRNRYGVFRADPSKPMVRAHRFSWERANGPIPRGLYVCHNCPAGDNPACVNPAHLFLGTQRDNMRDCLAKGRMPLGEARPQSKLSVDDVLRIREMAASGRSQSSLAREYGVKPPTVRAIVLRRKWRSVA